MQSFVNVSFGIASSFLFFLGGGSLKKDSDETNANNDCMYEMNNLNGGFFVFKDQRKPTILAL